jgi:hypothetical protein
MCILLSHISISTSADICDYLIHSSPDDALQSIVISKPGNYCLTKNIVQQQLFDTHAWKYRSANELILFDTYDPSEPHEGRGQYEINPIYTKPGESGPVFDLNLNGQELTSKLFGEGVVAVGIQRIKIRNGIINTINTAIRFGNYNGALKYSPLLDPLGRAGVYDNKFEDALASETLDKKSPTYTDSYYLVDNIKIHAGYRGVVLGGGGNIIRNSTIEVDGKTAIYMYGPNPIIENNTIIIHNDGNDYFYQKGGKWIWENSKAKLVGSTKTKLLSAPIKLRDAKGGIIRNNKIIYKGGFLGFGKAPVAINLLDSKDVLIENNTIEGFDKLVRENGDTSFTEKNNIFVR